MPAAQQEQSKGQLVLEVAFLEQWAYGGQSSIIARPLQHLRSWNQRRKRGSPELIQTLAAAGRLNVGILVGDALGVGSPAVEYFGQGRKRTLLV